jgi:hypothetical protein
MSERWQAFHEQKRAFEHAGDKERLKMVRTFDEAFAHIETNPIEMVQRLRSGRDLARQLGEPWWVFFYEVWMANAIAANVRDSLGGLRQALHCVNELRKPRLQHHPWRFSACNTLLGCYLETDPLGHLDAIRQALKQLDRELPPGPSEDRYLMLSNKRDYYIVQSKLKQAEAVAIKHQSLFDADRGGSTWYLVFAIMDLCWIAFRRKDWDGLAHHAEHAEKITAPLERMQLRWAESPLWLAIVARRRGDEMAAQRRRRIAESRIAHLGKRPAEEHHDALAHFHEVGGDLEAALAVRDEQIAKLQGTGRAFHECATHLKRCRLLARLGRLSAADLDLAREPAARLKYPEAHLRQVNRMTIQ